VIERDSSMSKNSGRSGHAERRIGLAGFPGAEGDRRRRFVEGLAAGRMVVRYDRVRTGMSDRERPKHTFTPARLSSIA